MTVSTLERIEELKKWVLDRLLWPLDPKDCSCEDCSIARDIIGVLDKEAAQLKDAKAGATP